MSSPFQKNMNVCSSFFKIRISLYGSSSNNSNNNAGINNDRIADMQARMYSAVVDNKPDAVIIYWDSDVSDQLVDVLNEQSTIDSYKSNCVSVFTTCQRASPRQLIAVAGYVRTYCLYKIDVAVFIWINISVVLKQFHHSRNSD